MGLRMSKGDKSHYLGGIGNAFSDRNFQFYSIGAIATWIGFFIRLVAVSWYTWELTHSTNWLAFIALLDIAPNILLTPLAGAIADRYDKYRIMGWVSSLVLFQAIVITILAWSNKLTIWPFAIFVLIHGIIISFMIPAMYGILPRFVKRSCLTSAIAVSSSYSQLAMFLGPAIAGWMISTYGVAVVFAANAIGYIIYLISWLFLKTPDSFIQPKKSEESVWGDVKDGFSYILNHKGIASILVLLLVGDSLGASIFYMAPAFSEQILGLGVVGVSVILAAKGIGAALAAFWIAYQGEKIATPQRMLWGFFFFVISVFVIFSFKTLWVSVVAFVVLGIAVGTYHTVMTSLVQLSVRESQRGRVMGTMFMLAQFASGVGTYLIGSYAVNYGLAVPTLITASVCFAVWIFYFFNRHHIIHNFPNTTFPQF